VTEVTVRQNKDGEAVMTIRVTGSTEIFRFAYYMAHGPVDHLTHALPVFRYLRRRWGFEQFKEHDRRLTGGKVVERGWQRDLRREP
jgi:hypothetical protein